jgi:hypothetical protein
MNILNKETYNNLLKMLCSPDKENMLVGLNCINELELEKNLLFILLLRKLGYANAKEWAENAPLASNRLTQLVGWAYDTEKISYMSFIDICKMTKEQLANVSRESLEVLMDYMVEMIKTQLMAISPDLIEELIITIKFKK